MMKSIDLHFEEMFSFFFFFFIHCHHTEKFPFLILISILIYILPIVALQVDLIYESGVKVSAKVMEILDTITSDPSGDRLYINTFFFAMFPEKYIKKQMKKGMNRSSVLKKFRDSKRHQVMKGEPHM